jgi:hypothetical protein
MGCVMQRLTTSFCAIINQFILAASNCGAAKGQPAPIITHDTQ